MLDQQFPVPSPTNGPVAPESRQPERLSLAIPLGVLTVAAGMLTGLGWFASSLALAATIIALQARRFAARQAGGLLTRGQTFERLVPQA
jgi:ABC-type transport system involved in cytochrome bd biosynthesis fused ATPase/permease subunit